MSIELYKQIILTRSKSVKFRKKPESFIGSAFIKNPLCGDELTVYINADSHKRVHVNYEGYGCAICFSSADLMAETTEAMNMNSLPALINDFISMLEKETPISEGMHKFKDDFAAIAKTRDFPSRIKCATLPWTALSDTLDNLKKT